MTRVLVIVGHYLPGNKGGGPVRSIANLVDALGEDIEFSIITRDRDLGDKEPYANVERGSWRDVGNARVLYMSPLGYFAGGAVRQAAKSRYDLLFLNSFFDIASVYVLLFRTLGWSSTEPLLLAPRGEFSPGALALKSWKKRLYIRASRLLGLWDQLKWVAASATECDEIRNVVGPDARVTLAPNLPSPIPRGVSPRPQKRPGFAHAVFVSRISPKKNLDYALEVMQKVQGDVRFDVYGPAEDETYWAECQALANMLPPNIAFHYHGSLPGSQVSEVFANAHLLLFPTHGENYGHVIVEALGAGCPVVISDRTPWVGLVGLSAGWDLPLERPERFTEVVSTLVAMGSEEFDRWSRGARALAASIIEDSSIVERHRRLFATTAEDRQ